MRPTWLIERGVYDPQATSLRTEVESQGMRCFEVDYQPGKTPPSDILGCPSLGADDCVVFWGTIPLARQIQLRRSWIPGAWCNLETLKCSAYYAHFGPDLLNRSHAILTGADAIQQEDRIYSEFGQDDEIFVRPNGVLKIFSGRVVFRDDFREALAPFRYDPTAQLVVSIPKEIGREWRLVVADDDVVASSQYRDTGAIAFSEGCPEEVKILGLNVLRAVSWLETRKSIRHGRLRIERRLSHSGIE